MTEISAFVIAGSYDEHPNQWTRIATGFLVDQEVYEVNEWLRKMARARYDIVGATRPNPHLIVFFEEKSDAAMFKLAWAAA
jgi:hypothetical protein